MREKLRHESRSYRTCVRSDRGLGKSPGPRSRSQIGSPQRATLVLTLAEMTKGLRLEDEPLNVIGRELGLNRVELGDLFGVSRQAVSGWIDEGIPPSVFARRQPHTQGGLGLDSEAQAGEDGTRRPTPRR